MSRSIPSFAVNNWQFTLIVFGMLIILGVNSFISTPKSEDPHFPIATIIVRASLPGANPVEIEQLITKPIEDRLAGLDAIRKIRSDSTEGASSITIAFDQQVDVERKFDEVVRELDALEQFLPNGVLPFEIHRARTTEVAIVQVALVSEHLPMRLLEKSAARLTDRLDQVSGVREARYWGAPASEVSVSINLPKLTSLQLHPEAVLDALQLSGDETPIGTINVGPRRFSINSGGTFHDLERIRNTVVRNSDGKSLLVDQLATVSWKQEEARHLVRYNGKRAVFVTATQKEGADIAALTASINKELSSYERLLPGGVNLERIFEQNDNVNSRISRLLRDFVIAIVLVLLTLLPLGFRSSFIVMISIPLSMLIALALLDWMGFTINQLTIAGFVLSLGLVVDDSIVVTENVFRHLHSKKSRIRAAIEGTEQISLAVLGCTATLLLAFLPLLLLPGESGEYIRSLPATVMCTVGVSLFVSLTIIPFLASIILPTSSHSEGNLLKKIIDQGIQQLYSPILSYALGRPRATCILALLVCASSIPIIGSIGTSFFPPAETPQFLVRISTVEGISIAGTDNALRFVERTLSESKEVKSIASNLGSGNPQIYYNQPRSSTRSNFAEVFVNLKEWKPNESGKILSSLQKKFNSYPGAKITVVAFENGAWVEAPIAVRVSGQNLQTIKVLSAQLEDIIGSEEGVSEVINPLRVNRTDLELSFDESKSAALGVRAGASQQLVRLALSGVEIARLRDIDGDDYPIIVRLPFVIEKDYSNISNLQIPNESGSFVPLVSISDIHLVSNPSRISRYNRERTSTITAQIDNSVLLSVIANRIERRVNQEMIIPTGYSLSLGGVAEAHAKSLTGLNKAAIFAIFGILGVLVLEFGSFRTAFVVACVIPLGVFGASVALWVTGHSLSFTATIGMIALIGIEIKNSIILVDFTEKLKSKGMSSRQALERAGEVRFLPILLTSVTAIGGLLPLALENSGLYSPIAIVLIGGLLTSTLLSRIVVPAFYLLIIKN